MKLVYFAWLRERLGVDEEQVVLPEHVKTVGSLFEWLKNRNETFADVFEHDAIIQVAINQKHERNRDAAITEASEIALFPPMTGG
ncbi:MAG: molybdopterin converting factor subunit 1 [Pseudomonadota bacterium]